ncbi:hypothetical protein V6N12_024593 [Hibiscus sabdariffa]|uniref:Uncharacterized protein n=1 Tax=Hibiscus sabdariffa TaxID=183260 RepID=A0ABR2G1H9_9ROSI
MTGDSGHEQESHEESYIPQSKDLGRKYVLHVGDTSLPGYARNEGTNHFHDLTFALLRVVQAILGASDVSRETLVERLRGFDHKDIRDSGEDDLIKAN